MSGPLAAVPSEARIRPELPAWGGGGAGARFPWQMAPDLSILETQTEVMSQQNHL